MSIGWWSWVVLALADAVGVPPPQPQIFDGTEATTCQWPTQAMLEFAGCSATLVSPWIVTTAAHCVGDVDNPGDVLFGESLASPTQSFALDYCRRGPDWNPAVNNGVGGSDISFCKLASPVYDYPVTPIVYGCETEILSVGRSVWIVGIGNNADDDTGYGIKRMGETVIVFVDDDITENGIGLGNAAHDSCSGDSGGPAYVQYPDGSWHVFGVTSGGPEGCGSFPSNYTAIHAWVPWIEETSGIDVTPCHDVDGTWNPTGWCQGFEMDPFDAGDWSDMCLGEVSPASSTCGAAFDSKADAVAPTVQITGPADATVFDAAPADLTVEIDADDGDGWGVRVVRISIDGEVQPTELREPPFRFNASFPRGGYEIVAIAEDFAGNFAESAVVRIAVDAELPPLPEGTSTGADTGADTNASGSAETSTGAAGSSSSAGSTSDATPGQRDDDGGCGCSHATTAGTALPLFVLLGARPRRRRIAVQARRSGARVPA